MPIILHHEPDTPSTKTKREDQDEDGSSFAENLLVRIGIGTMTGIAGLLVSFRYGSRAFPYDGIPIGPMQITFGEVVLGAGIVGFVIGFVVGDNISEDWFENMFGGGRYD